QPGQLHVITAGCVFALAAAALGVSLRRCRVLRRMQMTSGEQPVQAAATYLATPPPSISDSAPHMLPLVTERIVTEEIEPISSAKFWLLTALLALLAALGGLYFGGFVGMPQVIDFTRIKDEIHNVMTPESRRIGLHIVFGISILVLV